MRNLIIVSSLMLFAAYALGIRSCEKHPGIHDRVTLAATHLPAVLVGGRVQNMPSGDTLNVDGALTVNTTITATAGQSELGNLNVGILSPVAITGTVNDWNPTNWTNAATTVIEASLSGTTVLNSLVALNVGSTVSICNMSATFNLTIQDSANASGGTAAFRFENQGGFIVLAHHTGPEPECASYVYDGTLTKWMNINTTASTLHALTLTSGLVVESSGSTLAGGTSMQLAGNSFTSSEADAAALMTSTFDTTAGPLQGTAINCTSTSTRSAGANNLTNVCGQFNASGGQINDAIVTLAGNNIFNQTSGSTTFDDGATVSGARLVLSTGTSRLADTATGPTLTSCGGSPSVTVGEGIFTVTTGTLATGCVASFATAFTNTPTCTVTSENGTPVAYTRTTLAVTLGAGTAAGALYDVACVDH